MKLNQSQRPQWRQMLATGQSNQLLTTSAEIERRIKAESIKSEIIGTEGGFVKNFESKVTFSSGAYSKTTEVQTSFITDFSDCPKDKIPIAPSIKCSPSGKVNQPALVEIDHWAFPTGGDFYVDIYRKDNVNSQRHFFKKVFVEANKKVSFYTDHFTIYKFLVDCILWIKGIVAVQIHVYISDAKQSIACVCCLKSEKVNNDVIQSLKESGSLAVHSIPKTAHIKRDDQVKISIKCIHPSQLGFFSLDESSVPTTKKVENIFLASNILKKCSESFDSVLGLQHSGMAKYRGPLRFRYSDTTENGKPFLMQILWPITNTQSTNVQSQNTTYVTGQFVNYGGQMKANQHGGLNKISSAPQTRNESPDQNTSEQSCSTSIVTTGTYTTGRMTLNQRDTTTQVFSNTSNP